MAKNTNNEGEWIKVMCKKNKPPKKHKYRECTKCEITTASTCNNLTDMFKCVSIGNDNAILTCILDKLEAYFHNGAKFIILPESGKYEIEVIEIYKTCVLLKQSHLHTDLTLQKGFKNHAFRYVKITW